MRVKIYRKIIRPIVRTTNGIGYIGDWHDDDNSIKDMIASNFQSREVTMIEWEEKYIECGEIER